jgi:alkylation response protein AidB-like acyl-CoA dehydrogenase
LGGRPLSAQDTSFSQGILFPDKARTSGATNFALLNSRSDDVWRITVVLPPGTHLPEIDDPRCTHIKEHAMTGTPLRTAMITDDLSGVGVADAERLASAGHNPASIDAAQRMLADIRELAPAITARVAEIEAGRRIPLDLVEALKSLGVFRMLAPRSHGGLELDLPEVLEVIGALGRIDGSVGWIAMVGGAGAIASSLLPRETYDRIYQNGPDVIVAASGQPGGTAELAGDSWRISGRWPFASGCQHADFIFALCIMTESGNPLPGPAEGVPRVRGFFLPARHWQLEDTWYAAGLKGTGSHHVALSDRLVPAANFLDLASSVPCLPGPLYQALQHFAPLMLGAVALGMAEGALHEIVELANTGRRQQRAPAPMRESEMFQGELGRVEAELRAARAFLQVQAASHWGHALAGTLKGAALLTQGTQAGIWITTACVRAADACFALGGSSALYDSSP